jgi:hypothetical protein
MGTAGAAVDRVKANGDLCVAPAECSSGICEENQVGESHCYGDAKVDGTCGATYDCSAGVCIPRSLTGDASICIDSIDVCLNKGVSQDCTAAVIDFCRLLQFCGPSVSSNIPATYKSLNYCIGNECTGELDGVGDRTPAQCLEYSNAILSGSVPCP